MKHRSHHFESAPKDGDFDGTISSSPIIFQILAASTSILNCCEHNFEKCGANGV